MTIFYKSMSPKKAILILFILAALIGGSFYFLYIKNLETGVLPDDKGDKNIVQEEREIKKTPAQIQEENEAKRAEMVKILESLNVQSSSEASATGASTTASSTITNTVIKPAAVIPTSPDEETPEMKVKREEMIRILESLNVQK